jgi:hypothetical protein
MLAEKTIKKEVGVLYIEPKRVKEYWPLAEFMVKEGLQYDGNPMSVLEMKKRIESGEYQLFIMFGSDDGEKYKVFGVFVTTISTLPNFKQVEVLLLKGRKKRTMARRGCSNDRRPCNTIRLQKNSGVSKTWLEKFSRTIWLES